MEQTGGPTTGQLIRRVHAGDEAAREALFARCLPLLQQWAHGRLPGYARDLSDTNDLVQVTLIRALNRLDAFEFQGTGSFLAYLRRILLHAVRDEIRRTGRRGPSTTLNEREAPAADPSPVEELVGREELARYESALARMPLRQQETLILRIEFGMSFPDIAAETASTPDAVRMMFHRAKDRLAAAMQADEGTAAG